MLLLFSLTLYTCFYLHYELKNINCSSNTFKIIARASVERNSFAYAAACCSTGKWCHIISRIRYIIQRKLLWYEVSTRILKYFAIYIIFKFVWSLTMNLNKCISLLVMLQTMKSDYSQRSGCKKLYPSRT